KREQATYWRDYVSSLWAGLGWASRSSREGRMLQALRAAGLPCPEFMAAGEDDRGRAFLLVRELEATQELRQVLRQPGVPRRPLARRLGQLLASLHDAGFCHADLYSKHVHVDRAGRGGCLAPALAYVRAQAARLLLKRHVREARQAPMAVGVQNLVWLDGEALCVTREFLESVGGQVPKWLLPAHWPRGAPTRRTVVP